MRTYYTGYAGSKGMSGNIVKDCTNVIGFLRKAVMQ